MPRKSKNRYLKVKSENLTRYIAFPSCSLPGVIRYFAALVWHCPSKTKDEWPALAVSCVILLIIKMTRIIYLVTNESRSKKRNQLKYHMHLPASNQRLNSLRQILWLVHICLNTALFFSCSYFTWNKVGDMLATCKFPMEKAREINISFLRRKTLNCPVFHSVGKSPVTGVTWHQVPAPKFNMQAYLFIYLFKMATLSTVRCTQNLISNRQRYKCSYGAEILGVHRLGRFIKEKGGVKVEKAGESMERVSKAIKNRESQRLVGGGRKAENELEEYEISTFLRSHLESFDAAQARRAVRQRGQCIKVHLNSHNVGIQLFCLIQSTGLLPLEAVVGWGTGSMATVISLCPAVIRSMMCILPNLQSAFSGRFAQTADVLPFPVFFWQNSLHNRVFLVVCADIPCWAWPHC